MCLTSFLINFSLIGVNNNKVCLYFEKGLEFLEKIIIKYGLKVPFIILR